MTASESVSTSRRLGSRSYASFGLDARRRSSPIPDNPGAGEKLADRENCTLDVAQPDGGKTRLHVKRYAASLQRKNPRRARGCRS